MTATKANTSCHDVSAAQAADRGAHSAGLLRRLAAAVYDGLLVIALWMAGAAVWVLARGEAVPAGDGFFRLYLLLIAYVFFVGFWVGAGRTLGMQAWRLRLVDKAGGCVSIRAASIRFGAAMLSWLPAGLGFLWGLFDGKGRAWHDRLSGTRLITLPKPSPRR